ncbi:hypothetical protein [Oceanicaulis alexandrii]|uniref:hypothetical protein n=1 Tax=Oceanicaulis alexandrii TaxID=153233 RepID=UPI003BB093F6
MTALRITAMKLLFVAGLRGSVTLANVGLFALIGAVFGADAVGRYATYLAFVMIFGSLMACGLPQMLMRRSAIPANSHKNIAARLRSVYWLGWLIASTVGTLLIVPVFVWINTATSLNAPIIAVTGPAAYAASMMVMEELRGRGRPEQALLSEHTPTTLSPFAAVAVIAGFGLPETALIGALVSVHVLAAAIFSAGYVALSGLRGSLREAAHVLSAIPVQQLASMALMRCLAACSGYLAILLVSIVTDVAVSGLVAVVQKLTGLASTLAAIVNSVYASRFGAARRSLSHLRKLMLQTAVLNGAGMTVVLAPMVAVPSLFLTFFSVGGDILGAETMLRLVAASILLRGFCGTPDLLFLVTGKAWIEIAALSASLAVLAAFVTLGPVSVIALGGAMAVSQILRLALSVMGVAWVLRGSA